MTELKAAGFSPEGLEAALEARGTYSRRQIQPASVATLASGKQHRTSRAWGFPRYRTEQERSSGAGVETARNWSARSGKCMQTLSGYMDEVSSAVFRQTAHQG